MALGKTFENWTKKLIWRRRDAYRRLFLDNRGDLSPDAEIVLADMKRFCCATKATIRLDEQGKVDPYAMAIAEGRREVWNRMNSYLYIDEKVIQNLTETEKVYE
jgi:hypothetical protein